MIVKPASGLRVLDPGTRRELVAGQANNVPSNAYWLRLLRDGDVVAITEQVNAAQADKKSSPAVTES